MKLLKQKRSIRIGLIIIVAVVVLVGIGFYLDSRDKPTAQTGTSGPSGPYVPPTPITYENIESELPQTGIVRDLPKNAVILLKFFHFEGDTRVWEKSYILTASSVKEGTQDADVTLVIHSKYLDTLNVGNFCSTIENANKNGDLGLETSLSKVELAWKFRSMSAYKKCIGL